MKQPFILPFLYYRLATAFQVDSNRFSNSKLNYVLYNCLKVGQLICSSSATTTKVEHEILGQPVTKVFIRTNSEDLIIAAVIWRLVIWMSSYDKKYKAIFPSDDKFSATQQISGISSLGKQCFFSQWGLFSKDTMLESVLISNFKFFKDGGHVNQRIDLQWAMLIHTSK